ncbi:MAG: PilN domain-containing protein [Proteobacteria bacterium]|nr:PilN domain-containing protein [Pseudomonadota bacterium]
MKRINLIPKEPLFPLSESIQRKIVYPIILIIIIFYSLNFYRARKDLDSLNDTFNNLKVEIEAIKKSLTEKNLYLEKSSAIEKEFLTIKDDYYLLKKNIIIKDIFEKLTGIVPQQLWITAISYTEDSNRSVNINGKSFNKDAIFLLLNNCLIIGKNPELIGIDKEDGNVYSFSIRVDII